MSIVRKQVLPKCGFCGKNAKYDAPTKRGPWANMCENCAKENMRDSWKNSPNLTTFEKWNKPETSDAPVVIGIECNGIESIMMDDVDREIECPKCHDVRIVEPDANYEYVCEGCGQKVKCPNMFL